MKRLLFVCLISVSIGIAVGSVAEYWDVNRYIKLALIAIAVNISIWLLNSKKKCDQPG